MCPPTSYRANKGKTLLGRIRWKKKKKNVWLFWPQRTFLFQLVVQWRENGEKTHRALMSVSHKVPSRRPTAWEPSRDATWFHLPSLHLGHQLKGGRKNKNTKSQKSHIWSTFWQTRHPVCWHSRQLHVMCHSSVNVDVHSWVSHRWCLNYAVRVRHCWWCTKHWERLSLWSVSL